MASSALGTPSGPTRTRLTRAMVALSVLAASLSIAIVGSAASPAWATPSTPSPATIACPTSTAYLSQNSPTQLYAEAFGSGTIAFNPVGTPTSGMSYNAIGIDPLNGYLYAVETSPNNHNLLRINPTTATVEDLGSLSPAITGSNILAGAFDPAGDFYASSNSGATLYEIDVVAGTASTITLTAAPGLADYTYVGGYLFGLSTAAKPVRIDPTTGIVTTFATLPGVSTGTFGAAFTLGNGDADFGNNSGGVTEVEIDNPGTATPTFTVISSASSASASSNDGAACISASTHLSVTTTAPPSVTPGASLTWTFTVTNAGPSASSGYSLSEALPAGYTHGTLPAGCSASGQTITCTRGALAENASSTIAIPATAPGSAGCETNAATVSGNEADSDPGNSDSTTSADICVTGSNAQTITFAQPDDISVGSGTTTLAATSDSTLAVTYTSDTTNVCTVSGSTVTLISAGTCTIDADQAGNATYAAAATVTQSFAVTGTPQTITFGQPDDVNLIAGTDDMAATADSTLPITYTSSTPAVCTISGNAVTLVEIGTCTISADQPGDATHAAAETVTQSFGVTSAAQTITFNQPSDANLAAGTVELTATADSTLPVTYTSETPSVCSVSEGTVTLIGVGPCTIDADQSGDDAYLAAPTVTQSFNVDAIAQTITFTAPSDTALTAGPVDLTATVDSTLAVAYTSTTPGICTVSGATVTLVSAGICTIAADQPGDATHAAAPTITRSFTVTSAGPPPSSVVQTITFGALSDSDANAGPVAVTASSDSGLTVTFTSGTAEVCTVSGTTVTLLAAGTCTIDADQEGDATYAAASTVTRSFTVTATPQTITFAQPADTNVTADTLALTGSVDSELTVAYTSGTPSVCTVSGTTVTLLAAGTCMIDADQVGDATHAAASTVMQSFTVTAAAQLITFAQPADVDLTAGPVALTATADSTLPISYTSSTPSVCSVAANIVMLIAPGACTINADQEGDATFAAATTVTRSFNVAITVVPPDGGGPATQPLPVVTVDRIGGTDRDATAAQLATTMYPVAASAGVVVLARDDLYADGLTGSPLANALNGPLLLTATATLSADALAAIQHVLPAGGLVICLGGANAISDAVFDQLHALGYDVQRIGGADRYATATLIANRIASTTSVTQVYLATGENFADALPAADAAGLNRGVVLLTANTTMPAATSAWMTGHSDLTTTAVGGSAAAADPTALSIVGIDRYATAAQVAAAVAPDATGVVLATGVDFPDGLAGAAYAVHFGWSLLLLDPTATGLNATQASYLHVAGATVTTVTTIGGITALPSATTGFVTADLH